MTEFVRSARDKFTKLQEEKSSSTTTSLSLLLQISEIFAYADYAVERVDRKKT